MKWSETVASTCRYGEVAGRLFGDTEIIWESSESDYQGGANILAAMPDGRFAHYEWCYGSCSGCDDWECRGLSDDDIAKEMAEGTAWLDNRDVLQKYLHLDEPNWKDPDSQWGHPTDGSVFTSMRKAAQQWLASQAEGGGQ